MAKFLITLLPLVLVLGLLSYFYGHTPQTPPEEPPQKTVLTKTSPLAIAKELQQRTPSSLKPTINAKFEKSFLENYPGKWTFSRSETGETLSIISIKGGTIPDIGKDQELSLKFAKELAGLQSIDPTQVEPASSPVENTPLSTSHHFTQKFQDHEVFEGGMSVFSTKDGNVYLINNRLKPIEPVELEEKLNFQEAIDLLKAQYQEQKPEIVLIKEKPVLWANQTPHELAWELSVEVKKPSHNRYQVLVGAFSKQILLTRQILVH